MHCYLRLFRISSLDKVFQWLFQTGFFSFERQKKLSLFVLDRWSSYAVTIVWELGRLSIGCLRRVVTAGSKCRCQVPGVRFEMQVPGPRCQVPGSSICKNKLWIDFYTSSDIFKGFLGILLGYFQHIEAVKHTGTVTVTPY